MKFKPDGSYQLSGVEWGGESKCFPSWEEENAVATGHTLLVVGLQGTRGREVKGEG